MVPRLRSPIVWGPISLALLVIVIWRSRLWESGSTLQTMQPGLLLAALLLSLLPPILWAVRSAALLTASGHPVPILALVPLTTFANTINNLTPGSVGELARLYLLRAQHGVDYATGSAVILIERLVAIGYLSGSALLAWLAAQGALPLPFAVAAWIALLGSPGIAYALRLRPIAWCLATPLHRLGGGRWPRVVAGLLAAEERVGRLLTDPLSLARFATVTTALFAFFTSWKRVSGRVDPAIRPNQVHVARSTHHFADRPTRNPQLGHPRGGRRRHNDPLHRHLPDPAALLRQRSHRRSRQVGYGGCAPEPVASCSKTSPPSGSSTPYGSSPSARRCSRRP